MERRKIPKQMRLWITLTPNNTEITRNVLHYVGRFFLNCIQLWITRKRFQLSFLFPFTSFFFRKNLLYC